MKLEEFLVYAGETWHPYIDTLSVDVNNVGIRSTPRTLRKNADDTNLVSLPSEGEDESDAEADLTSESEENSDND